MSDNLIPHLSFEGGARLIFVGGSPRSGTTLMQNMLDSHPEIAGGPEFDHIPDIAALAELLHRAVGSGRINLFLDQEQTDSETGLFVERLLYPYLARRGRCLLSEKTPRNVLHFQPLLRLFPNARFIFCLRDPRAVLASMLQVGKRAQGRTPTPDATRDFWQAVKLINIYNNAGFEAVKASERVLLVLYEGLVARPEQETRRLCEFLNIGWSASMLKSGEVKHDGEATLDNVWYSQEMYYSNPDPSRAEKWRRELTPYQQALGSLAFAEDARLLQQGYDFGLDGIPGPVRHAARVAFVARRWWRWRRQQFMDRLQGR